MRPRPEIPDATIQALVDEVLEKNIDAESKAKLLYSLLSIPYDETPLCLLEAVILKIGTVDINGGPIV